MSSIELRVLDPLEDEDLFHTAWSWRPSPKKHVGTNRAPFETFISDDPRQIVIGLFNGQFLAAFVFYEFEPRRYEAHFTSHKKAPRGTLIQGSREIIKALFDNGAVEITAGIMARNRPLRRFVEELGFIAGQNDTGSDTLSSESEPPTQSYVKYVLNG